MIWLKVSERISAKSSTDNIKSFSVKTSPNYPPYPPMPASRHLAQVLHIPADYQLPERSDTSEN